MANSSILIWGAGKIGRGFIADLFHAAGYELVLVDQSQELVDALRRSGQYLVVRAEGEGQFEEQMISGYTVLHPDESEAVAQAVLQCDLMALAIFPGAFETAAQQIAPHLLARLEARPFEPCDILLCTNLSHAAQRFAACLHHSLGPANWQKLSGYLGLVETLVIRMVPEPPDERSGDPLLVWTNGYPELPVDRESFIGTIPPLPSLRPVEDMYAEEKRKMYTYNLAQAVLGYHGALHGFPTLIECYADEAIRKEMLESLDESSSALQAEFGFSLDDTQKWIAAVIEQVSNRHLGDTVKRICADPIRKLEKNDRLVGAARLAHAHGLPAPALARAIAAALHYREANDPGAELLQRKTNEAGIQATMRHLCGLTTAESDLEEDILAAYVHLPLEIEWRAKIERAEKLGFEYEKTYHGCGQCTFAAITETLGVFDDGAFDAATGLSGGLGLDGDSTCSALLGAVLAIGVVYPRSREEFSGGRENKYKNFELTQKLVERFRSHFGSVRCHDIHTRILGRSFDLRDRSEREAFEEAGAHEDKCTTTVALAARWAMELLAPPPAPSLRHAPRPFLRINGGEK
jgi:mannitol-1-phosphate 5-dehydrogenase